MIHRRTTAAVLFLVLLVGAQLAGAERPIAQTDLMRFVWIGDPQISPDGSRVVFVRVTVNAKADRYDTAVWMVSTGGQEAPRPLTTGPRDTTPRWSPDGRHLVFARALEKDGKPQPPQLFVMDLAGGEPRQLTDLPRGASSAAWSPDGRTLAFLSTTLPQDLRDRAPANQDEPEEGDATRRPESDVRVITKATYRSNGGGYTDPERRSHIWVMAVEPVEKGPATPRPLTSGPFDESSPVWSPDGARVFFSSTRSSEPYYEDEGSACYAVDLAGGDPVKITGVNGSVGQPAVSPDGRQVALVGALNGHPVRSYNQPDLFVAATTEGPSARNLTPAYDFDIGAGISGDQRAPRGAGGSAPVWSADGRSIFVLAAEQGRANLKRVDAASGQVLPVTQGDHDIMSWSVSRDRTKAVLLVSSPTEIGDLYLLDLSRPAVASSRDLSRLTRVNQSLFAQLDLPVPEELWYPSFDGRKIHGWILKPPGFDPAKRYPLILQIHGGPHAAYGYTFTHEFAWMAARGYVVLYTNPRGSSSYGQEFGNLIQHRYPGDDYRDLMAGVDAVLARGYVDEKRMGVTGGSGGGVLTNWTITQTSRFAAAVSQRSIADWAAFWYTADFTLFKPTWFRAAPWEDPKDFTGRSAITHVAKITTPLMLVEGEADYRTPPGAGGEMMFRALKYLKKPVVMVRFPNESHELSRSGQPWHRIERLEHIVGWFDKWILGKDSGAYTIR